MKRLLTRREVIELWSNPESCFLDYFVCPDCRDILFLGPKGLECRNHSCLNTEIFPVDDIFDGKTVGKGGSKE